MDDAANPCCGPPGTVFRGDYCRCCGKTLGGQPPKHVYCDRRPHGPCPTCHRPDTCGPHANDDTNSTMNPRLYCEFDGQRCDAKGACPTHGYKEARVR